MKKIFGAIIVLVVILIFVFIVVMLFSRLTQTAEQNPARVNSENISEEGIEVPTGDVLDQVPVIGFDELSKGVKREYRNDEEFNRCANDVVVSCLSRAVNERVSESGNIDYCNDLLTEGAIASCRAAQSYQLARANRDVSYCEGLDQGQKRNCLAEVASTKAVDAENLAECDVLGEEKESCVEAAASRLASKTGDVAWCDNIPEISRDICVQEVRFQIEELELQQRIEQEIAEQQRVEEERLRQEFENAAVEAAAENPTQIIEDDIEIAPSEEEAVQAPRPEDTL